MTRGTKATWSERVQRWQASELPAPEFAAREGVNANTLRWWRTHLKKPAMRQGFVEVAMPSDAERAGRIEVELRNGARVCVEGRVDASMLREVLALVGAA